MLNEFLKLRTARSKMISSLQTKKKVKISSENVSFFPISHDTALAEQKNFTLAQIMWEEILLQGKKRFSRSFVYLVKNGPCAIVHNFKMCNDVESVIV